MQEKDRMLAGELYDPRDEELSQDRKRAKKLCFQFNHTAPDQQEARQEILQQLFQTKRECHIEPSFYCDYGYNIEFGDKFYVNHNCVFLDVNRIIIGHNVMLGPAVQIYTASHPREASRRNSGLELGFPIEIGSNVWLGGGVIITPGVTIGEDSVIGAGSVVNSDIPAGVVAVGNPARVIREASSESEEQ